MNEVKMLAARTTDAYEWVNKLLNTIPYAQWDVTPDVVESNVTWQAGHLVVSFYYHSVMVIVGHQPEILKTLPIKAYSDLFTKAAPLDAVGKTHPEQLHNHLHYMQQESVKIIQSLSPEDLDCDLAPTALSHPIARSKREALNWNIHHTLWHCGQIALLKRVTGSRFDFGLKFE